jgi:hypothetical protein
MTTYDIETVFMLIGVTTVASLVGALIGNVLGYAIIGASRLIRKAGRWIR